MGDQVFPGREDQNPAGEGIGDVQVLAVVRQRRRRPHAAGPLRLGQLHEVGLADHQVGGRRVPGRNAVVDQDAVVAAVGDEEPLAVGEREAREIQGAGAPARVAGHVRIDFRPPRRQRHRERHVGRRRLVLAAAPVVVERADRLAEGLAVVRNPRPEIRLADDRIRGRVALGRHREVDQHAVETQIRDEHPPAGNRHRNRIQHPLLVGIVDAPGQVRFVARIQVGLAQHEIRGLPVRGRQRVPDQDAAVLGVGDEQLAVRQPDPLRAAHPARGGGRRVAGEVFLAEHHIRRGVGDGGDRMPQQHPIVVGVGDGDAQAVAGDSRGIVQAGPLREQRGLGRIEVGLAQHEIGPSDAGRAGPVLRQERFGARHEAGHAVVDQDAIADGPRAEAVAVGDEEPVPGERHALGRAEHLAARRRVLPGEALLADHEPGALVRDPDGLGPGRRARQRRRQEERGGTAAPGHAQARHTDFTKPPSTISDAPVT